MSKLVGLVFVVIGSVLMLAPFSLASDQSNRSNIEQSDDLPGKNKELEFKVEEMNLKLKSMGSQNRYLSNLVRSQSAEIETMVANNQELIGDLETAMNQIKSLAAELAKSRLSVQASTSDKLTFSSPLNQNQQTQHHDQHQQQKYNRLLLKYYQQQRNNRVPLLSFETSNDQKIVAGFPQQSQSLLSQSLLSQSFSFSEDPVYRSEIPSAKRTEIGRSVGSASDVRPGVWDGHGAPTCLSGFTFSSAPLSLGLIPSDIWNITPGEAANLPRSSSGSARSEK